MFCTKCGKKIDYNASICNECASAQGGFYNPPQEQPPQGGFYNPPQGQPFFGDVNNDPNLYGGMNNNYYGQPYQNPMPPAPPVEPVPKGSRMLGFGGALTSTILGFFAFIFALLIFSAMDSYSYYYYYDSGEYVFYWLTTLGLSIPTLILGIKSINVFKNAKVKPIATLILGINGVFEAVYGLLASFVYLMMLID